MKDTTKSRLRYVGRYVIAVFTIPVGVVVGVGGLAQNWSRKVLGRDRRNPAEPEQPEPGR